MVYIGIAIGVGTRHEGRREYGMAHFTEHMLFKGTKLRSSKHIIQRLEEIGGELNAYTSKEETILYALCPRAYAQRALQLMADIVQHSIFAPEELSREQGVVIDEIQSYEDSPSELIWDEFENLVFAGHSLGHNILGTERSVGSFTSAGLKRFFARHYRADNMVVFVQGDVDVHSLIGSVELHLGKANQAQQGEPKPRQEKALQLEPRCVVRRKDTHQRHVLIGASAYSMHDDRRLGLSLLVNILGGPGMSSRLNMSLRERAGLAYHVECSYTAYADTGLVAIGFGCAAMHEAKARDLALAELRRISSEVLSPQELSAAKRQLKGQMIVSTDNHENYFLSLGKGYLHYGKVESLETMMERIDALTSEELYTIAQEMFAPERMYTLIYR